MKLYAALLIAGIAGFTLWMFSSLGTPALTSYPTVASSVAHTYDGSESIESLPLVMLYFVPKDKTPVYRERWLELADTAITDLTRFHTGQFKDRSRIDSYVYPEPVIGHEETHTYDTDDTSDGNPSALRAIGDELDERIKPGGDLESLVSRFGDATPIFYIVYEGVGAAGAPGIVLINRKYLSDPEFALLRGSYVAHEFYHAIGVPDGYDREDRSFTADLMGLGRNRPLELNYLSAETLSHLGI